LSNFFFFGHFIHVIFLLPSLLVAAQTASSLIRQKRKGTKGKENTKGKVFSQILDKLTKFALLILSG
jgi:hypothetical protein